MKVFVLIQTDGYDSFDVCGVLDNEQDAISWVAKAANRTYEVHILGKILE